MLLAESQACWNFGHAGPDALTSIPLLNSIFARRSRRISRGLPEARAGVLSYELHATAMLLTELEEATLSAVTGVTGITLPDSPFQDTQDSKILGTPALELIGRAASSADNCQATHFFMLNDSGTYFLRPTAKQDLLEIGLTGPSLCALAMRRKRKVLDRRLDSLREFPAYFDRNRQISNVKGSMMFLPVIDVTRQYINAIMYLLSQPDGQRPVFLDDWRYRPQVFERQADHDRLWHGGDT
jgi:hypothetical protein